MAIFSAQPPLLARRGLWSPGRWGEVRPGGGFTLLELMVTVAIIGILALIAVPNLQQAHTRSKVALSKNNMRVIAGAMEMYRTDHGLYPQPVAVAAQDPYGVIAGSALRALTTPIAYVGPGAFRDPFGFIRLQSPVRGTQRLAEDDPFRPPTPGFNLNQSLLYFYYPHLGWMLGNAGMGVDSYALISVGPDLKDSFIVYLPFPKSLPADAGQYGINQVSDSVYDPTNGAVSGGDLADFGPGLGVAGLVGGGQQ